MDRLALCKLDIRNDIRECIMHDGSIHNSCGIPILDEYGIYTINQALSDGQAFSDFPRGTLETYIEFMQNNANERATYAGEEPPVITIPPECKQAENAFGITSETEISGANYYFAEHPQVIDNVKTIEIPEHHEPVNGDYYFVGEAFQEADNTSKGERRTMPNANYRPNSKKPKVRTIEEYRAEDALSNRDRKQDARQQRIQRPEVDEFGKNDFRDTRKHRDKKNSIKREEYQPEVRRAKSKNHVKDMQPNRY